MHIIICNLRIKLIFWICFQIFLSQSTIKNQISPDLLSRLLIAGTPSLW